MRILFVDNYDSFTYNVVELLRQFDDVTCTLVKNDELLPCDLSNYDKVIISPGPNLPKAAGQLMRFLEGALTQLPVLGICLGHQAILEHFGGILRQYEQPKHGEKTQLCVQNRTGLFKNLPEKFEVGLYHSWYVHQTNFPKEFDVTAYNKDGIIMAAQHKTLPIYTVQFHPESYMSDYGKEILQNFICCS